MYFSSFTVSFANLAHWNDTFTLYVVQQVDKDLIDIYYLQNTTDTYIKQLVDVYNFLLKTGSYTKYYVQLLVIIYIAGIQ